MFKNLFSFLRKQKKKMVKKCLYCREELPGESVIDFCEGCGKKVWGDKMFNAIVSNMEDARDRGDLCHINNTCELQSEPGSFNNFS